MPPAPCSNGGGGAAPLWRVLLRHCAAHRIRRSPAAAAPPPPAPIPPHPVPHGVSLQPKVHPIENAQRRHHALCHAHDDRVEEETLHGAGCDAEVPATQGAHAAGEGASQQGRGRHALHSASSCTPAQRGGAPAPVCMLREEHRVQRQADACHHPPKLGLLLHSSQRHHPCAVSGQVQEAAAACDVHAQAVLVVNVHGRALVVKVGRGALGHALRKGSSVHRLPSTRAEEPALDSGGAAART